MKLGIDFGTCFSFMASTHGDKNNFYLSTALVDDGDVRTGVPTLFMHLKDDGQHYYFGSDALARMGFYPDDFIKEIKKDIRKYPSRIDRTVPKENQYTYRLGGKGFEAEEIVRLIMKYLVETAQKNSRRQNNTPGYDSIDEITITSPVGSTDEERAREATALYNEMLQRVASEVTGIKDYSRIHILGEPVAAAIYHLYKSKSETDQTILVYDLGGGTFDAAIVEYNSKSKEKYNVIATSGYTTVGGGDWDNCLKDIIAEKKPFPYVCYDEEHQDPQLKGRGKVPEDVGERLNFESNVVKGKIELSTEDETTIRFTVKGVPYKVEVTRGEFEEASREYLEKTMAVVADVIAQYVEKKKLSHENAIKNIDKIVMVGGASQMPQVKRRLLEIYPKFKDSIFLDDPQLAIAAGAAIYDTGAIIQRVMHTYGVGSNEIIEEEEYEVHKGEKYTDPDDHQEKDKYWVNDDDKKHPYRRAGISNIIFKGTVIDSKKKYAEAYSSYTPSKNNQDSVEFSVYMSDSDKMHMDYSDKPRLFKYVVTVPDRYYNPEKNLYNAREFSVIVEFQVTLDGTLIVHNYEKNKDGTKGRELIPPQRFPD